MSRQKRIAILASIAAVFLLSFSTAQTQEASKTPKITNVRIISLASTADDKATVLLGIAGENLPDAKAEPMVKFYTADPSAPLSDAAVVLPGEKELLVKLTEKIGTEITRMYILARNEIVATTEEGFKLSLKKNPDEDKVQQFEIKFDHQKNKEFPNLHSLVVTKESGPDGAGFAHNPHLMTLDLVPTGATDLNVVQSNKQRLDLHFVAAADYEPKGVVVTVYDSSDLDKRKPVASSIDKKPDDPDQPKITGTEIVFIEREQGMGRIRIYGKGFGDYNPPPYPLDDYLRNCIRKFQTEPIDPGLSGGKRRRAEVRWTEDLKSDRARFEACVHILGKDSTGGTVAGFPLSGDLWSCPESFKTEPINPALHGKELQIAKDKWSKAFKRDEERRQECNEAVAGAALLGEQHNQLQHTRPVSYVTGAERVWEDQNKVRQNVTVAINPRNPDIRVEKVEILTINDKMIDAYFEFENYRGYALPFRLADATVTIKKKVQKTQEIKGDKMTGAVVTLKEQTYSVAYQPGPKRDTNLSYKYTVLDKESANTLVGRGIAENFFVVQVSVVNNGEKKVAIPLSAIQAEVEWAASALNKKEFRVGPATIPPVPLAGVSAYFDAYQKVKGARAIMFNVLDAATTLATGLVPFTGPSFEDAAVYFSGAGVPAARKAWGDLSGQQLQNITALSWESSETLPAKGGSKEKLIYIPTREEKVGVVEEEEGIKKEIWKQITNITDIEITGYEVTESEAKQATPSSAEGAAGASTPKDQPAGASKTQ